MQPHLPQRERNPEFITTIAQAEKLGKTQEQALEEAWYIYTDTSPFPSVCGRVCPAPCETGCNRKDLDGAVSINKIERAIGDFGIQNNLALRMLSEEKKPAEGCRRRWRPERPFLRATSSLVVATV